jgi:hypothetical protein
METKKESGKPVLFYLSIFSETFFLYFGISKKSGGAIIIEEKRNNVTK